MSTWYYKRGVRLFFGGKRNLNYPLDKNSACTWSNICFYFMPPFFVYILWTCVKHELGSVLSCTRSQ